MHSYDVDMQKILGCAICNEILCNPRTLTCEHSFCKECIDKITKFKEDLITIKCPLCEKEEVVEGDLSNLKPPLVLKQMLDLADRANVTLTCVSNGCDRQASLYCKESADYFCEKCARKHDALPTSLKCHPVKRSQWSNSMLPYCKDHDAFENLFCLSCAKLCCKYCKYEVHGEHVTMTLEDYNKARYEETTKELQNFKIKLGEVQKDIRNRITNHKKMEEDFLKSLAQRKNILIAKCIHMICDIEKNYQTKYCKMKSKYNDEFLQIFSVFDHAMAEDSKYSKGNSIEKFYGLNQLVVNIKECSKSLIKVDPKFEYNLDFDHSHDKGDELLFHSLYESFGVILTLFGARSVNCADLEKDFSYNPNLNFKNILKDDEEVCSFIKRTLDLELNQLNIVGKYCDRLFYVTCDDVVIENFLQFNSPNISQKQDNLVVMIFKSLSELT